MRPPAKIKNWLSTEKMSKWLQSAADERSHKRRLAIWLTHTGKLHANKRAEILGVSVQAVQLWIGQYNSSGPEGLERIGRGGRRWGFMTLDEEAAILKPFIRRVRSGKPATTKEIKKTIEQKLDRKVSLPYVYRLLKRHNFWDIIAQSKSRGDISPTGNGFLEISRPWQRDA